MSSRSLPRVLPRSEENLTQLRVTLALLSQWTSRYQLLHHPGPSISPVLSQLRFEWCRKLTRRDSVLSLLQSTVVMTTAVDIVIKKGGLVSILTNRGTGASATITLPAKTLVEAKTVVDALTVSLPSSFPAKFRNSHD